MRLTASRPEMEFSTVRCGSRAAAVATPVCMWLCWTLLVLQLVLGCSAAGDEHTRTRVRLCRNVTALSDTFVARPLPTPGNSLDEFEGTGVSVSRRAALRTERTVG